DSRTYIVCIPISSFSSRRTYTKSIRWNSSGNLEVFRRIFRILRLYSRSLNSNVEERLKLKKHRNLRLELC
ncbi:hypothetical protein GIB67_011771, partial [Kingdonia uniflora]